LREVLSNRRSSYLGVLWELPKKRMLQLINWDRPFTADGRFEYCDGFGSICRMEVAPNAEEKSEAAAETKASVSTSEKRQGRFYPSRLNGWLVGLARVELATNICKGSPC
jgi:hypothetical protein